MTKVLNKSALDLDVSDIVGSYCVLKKDCAVEFDGRKNIEDHLFVECGYLEIVEDKKLPKQKTEK